MDRRTLLTGLTAGMFSPLVIEAVNAAQLPDWIDFETSLRSVIGERSASVGKVRLELPPLAGSGNSVPLTVRVDSPMTAENHVRRVHVFAARNPRPHLFSATLGPRAGRAVIDTRIRLNGTQDVMGFAELSDGSLWTGKAAVEVTIGACDALMFRY